MKRSEIQELTGEDPADMFGEGGLEDMGIEDDAEEDESE